jgi:16S rRNA (guanine(966)-N(2))-methyltransferase RsmD
LRKQVRQAIFNMLQSRAGTLNSLPRSARWLDLFAGTGSVGLEALSRGVKEAHFVEMDQVVVSKILERNIKSCGFKGRAWTHTSKAEEFLRRSAAVPRFAGGPFDFISVCPPYLLVSYPELFELLDASPLVHPGTILFVEYPKQLAHQIVDSIGPLQRVRDRRYGRTWVALYAASGEGGDDGQGDGGAGPEDDPFLRLGL